MVLGAQCHGLLASGKMWSKWNVSIDDYRVCAFFGFLEQVTIGVHVNPVLRLWDPFIHTAVLWLPPQFNLLVESRHMQEGTQECYLRHFVLLLFRLSSSWVPQGRGEGWELSQNESYFTTYCVCVCVTLSTEPLWASALSFKTGNTSIYLRKCFWESTKSFR